MPSIEAITQDCINALIQLRQLEDLALPQPEILHGRLRAFIDTLFQRAAQAGLSREDANDVAYPIVALADELMLSRPDPLRGYWIGHLLQLHYFHENVAGEAFFTRLDAVRGDPRKADVLRVYYLALVFGFQGRYRVRGGELELMNLIESVQRDLGRAQRDTELLSPSGDRPAEALARVGRSSAVIWVGAGALALSLVFYLGLRVSLASRAGDVVDRVAAVQLP
jgi:type VI secretion system protein ImpK